MTSSATDFFDDVARRGHEPPLERVVATVRFDMVDDDRTERRVFRIDHGDIRVMDEDAPADCAVVADREVFDAVVDGKTSLLAALLRGVLTIDGDPELLVLIQRLFRDPGVGAGSRSASERRSVS